MTTLELRQLSTSDLTITPVGIGTAPIGSTSAWRVYWGPQDEADAIRAIRTALDLGVNWIDTSPFYGWGRAEQLIARAVKGRRDKVYLFSKCGTLNDGQGGWYESLKPESIRRELEGTLRNLQTDYLDLYQFHDPDPDTPIEESWAELQKLIQEGKVRYGGLSNHPIDLMQRAMAVTPITANQHQYNMFHRGIEADVLPFSRQQQIGVIVWSPLASGFLTDNFDPAALSPGDWRQRSVYLRADNYAKVQQIRRTLQQIAADNHKTMVDLAIAWVLRQPAVTGAIMGIRNAGEARAMLGGVSWQFTSQEIETIEAALKIWPA